MIVRRHPVLGVLGGALIGVGLALLFAMFGVAPIGPASFVAVVVFFGAIGLVYALVMPAPHPPAVRRG